MSVIQRWVLKTDTNGVSPTGSKSPFDSPTIMRKASEELGRAAQGACRANLSLALSPVAALATVTTTATGQETSGDTLTVANSVITFETSGAAASSNQVNIATGSAGTSTSGANPATTTGAGAVSFYININGDGAQLVSVKGASGAAIATALQVSIRALTPFNALNAVAYSSATVSYGSTYVITSGVKGLSSSVVVSANPPGISSAAGTTGAALLKLGILNGGTEAIGTYTTNDGIVALINGQTLASGFTTSSTTWAGICTAYACGNVLTLTASIPGTMGNGLALAVSSTGSVMVLTHVWGAATAGTEGTSGVFAMGL